MSTRSVYDTPPNGDFARYVEELGQQSAARLLAASGAAPAATRTPGRTARPDAAGRTAPAQGFKPVRQVLQLGFVLWLAYTVGSAFFPPLAVIGWPLLVFFIVAVVVRLKALPWADLAQAARREAEQKMRRPSAPK
ncbi:hypothetical protein [Pseudorhodoferax sp. Leaf267]|uniref:hypothetical protein n=1 Tax=Pseudorhodoferax sp. Leaf267 TaxID=1736316 RepID=UPI0006FC8D60|nr:hypothetical protein [Pseudorhodoferax sp. Leaf267]KQP22605.1 hypothetical protein ASF43_01415 [Pseudorhodoferax sp. Leaf267]